MKVVLIACCKTKASGRMAAKYLYQGALFKKALSYAQSINPDRIYILSAEYHLLPLDKEIGYYQNSLNDKNTQEKKAWAEVVLKQMKKEGLDFQKDEFIVLAGDNYCKYLKDSLSNFSRPFEGLRQGKQMQRLNQLLGICKK